MKKQTLVIKIGTNVITQKDGKTDLLTLHLIAKQISLINRSRYNICLVCSGAIGAGIQKLGLVQRPTSVVMRQVCASVGQGLLMNNLNKVFNHYDLIIGQVLISKETFENPKTKSNMHNSVLKMFKMNVIPIVNENDAISTYEIDQNFGDNDLLSLELSLQLKASKLILLTSVDGVFLDVSDKEPINLLSPQDVRRIKFGKKTSRGMGGMKSKVDVALKASQHMIETFIINGKDDQSILSIFNSKRKGTKISTSI